MKNYVPQTRVSVMGSNNIPIILMNQQASQVQPSMTNFKTFYNWNTNSDYNYNIEVEGKNSHRFVPARIVRLVEETQRGRTADL